MAEPSNAEKATWSDVTRDYVCDLQIENARLREVLNEAHREALYLAQSIWRSEYLKDSPDWEPCDDVAGIISQIDNMYAGMRLQRDEARAALQPKGEPITEDRLAERDAQIASLTGEIERAYVEGFGDGWGAYREWLTEGVEQDLCWNHSNTRAALQPKEGSQ